MDSNTLLIEVKIKISQYLPSISVEPSLYRGTTLASLKMSGYASLTKQ